MRPGRWCALILSAFMGINALFGAPVWAESAQPSPSPEATPQAAQALSNEIALYPNSRELGSLDGEGSSLSYLFTPAMDATFRFMSFDAASGESADLVGELYLEGEGQPLAVSEGGAIRISAQLKADKQYRLVVRPAGEKPERFYLEVMLDSYGRSFERPINLAAGDVRYTKTIAKARDTHWYAFTAQESGLHIIKTESTNGENLDTQGYLLDENGVQVAMNDDVSFPNNPNFFMACELEAGKTYYVRVNAFSNQVGAYRLIIVVPDETRAMPESISLSETQITLKKGERTQLQAQLTPENAYQDLVFVSSNPTSVKVSSQGRITALAPGNAQITVTAHGRIAAQCQVTVEAVPAQAIHLEEERLTLHLGDEYQLSPSLSPENADEVLTYSTKGQGVIEVDEDGLVKALAQGTDTLTLATADGRLSLSVEVEVLPARAQYRALVVGQQRYTDGRVRIGAANTTQGISDAFSNMNMDGAKYQTTMMMDCSREELLSAIEERFAQAEESDVSVFYINCHGGYENGVAYLELYDGSRLTAQALEEAFRAVKGTVVLLLDCCQSGGFIGENGISKLFSASKYIVLTSASSDQDSYRISYDGSDNEYAMATMFARSLSEGLGWDMVRDRTCSLKADFDHDRVVTIQELYLYTKRRVMYYLRSADGTKRQDVQLFPQGANLTIFQK